MVYIKALLLWCCLYWLFPQAAHAKLNDIELCSEVFSFNGEAYFCGNHVDLGKEVFRSNGTSAGTFVVQDIDLGPGSSSPGSFFEYKGFLYFIAETTLTGWALWRSDGTEAGTKRIKELNEFNRPYFAPSAVSKRLQIGNKLLLQVNGRLLATDGTKAGTLLLDADVGRDFHSSISYWPRTTYVQDGSTLYYITRNGLYRLDVESNESTLIMSFESLYGGSGYTAEIVENSFSNGKFFIVHYAESESPAIWQSDGTAAGTKKLKTNIRRLGASDHHGGEYINAQLGSRFIYCDITSGDIRSIDTGGNELVLLASNGISQCDTGRTLLENSNGYLYFNYGGSIWRSAGVSASTNLVFSGSGHSFAKFGSNYVFISFDGSRWEVWRTDGSSDKQRIATIPVGSLGILNGTSGGIFYRLAGNQDQLWASDGTVSGTRLIKELPRGSILFSWAEGHRLFFQFHDEATGSSYLLWHSDGTATGTYKLRYVTPDQAQATSSKPVISAIIQWLLEDENHNQ